MLNPTFSRSFTGFFAIFAAVGALAACSDEADGGGSGGSAGSGASGGSAGSGGSGGNADKAMLRVVHAAPTAPAVDLYAGGTTTKVVDDLAYGEASAYLELDPGALTVDVRAAGSAASDPAVFTTPSVTLEAGKKYTVVAAGDLASQDAADKFRVLPLEEGFAAPGAGNFAARIVHASFDAPTVGIDLGNDSAASPEVPSLERFADTGAAGVALPENTALQVGVVAGGAVVTAFTTPAVVPAGAEVFLIATGQLGKLPREDAGFSVLAVLPDSTTAWVRQNPVVYALHASPDAPNVDVFAGDQELWSDVPYGGLGARQVPPGSYTLDFFGAAAGATRPASNPAATATTPTLEAGQSYLAIATGELGNGTFGLVALQEGFDLTDAAKARVRVVHGSKDAPAVDLGPSSGGTLSAALLSNVAFGQDSGATGVSLDAGALRLGVAATGTTAAVAEFDLTLSGGLRAFAVAAGDFDDSSGNANDFGLFVVNAGVAPWTVSSVAPR